MKITSKGQITIPQHVRERCGLLPGIEVDFSITEDGSALLKVGNADKKAVEFQSWLSRVQGIATGGKTTDEIMNLTRGED